MKQFGMEEQESLIKPEKKSKFLTVKGFAGTRAIVYDRNIFFSPSLLAVA